MQSEQAKIELINWLTQLEDEEVIGKLVQLKKGFEEREKILAGESDQPLYAKGKAWEFFNNWDKNN